MRINLWLLLIIIGATYFLYIIRGDILQHKELAQEKYFLISKIKSITAENNTLSFAIVNVKNDKIIEKLARERLNLIKKGETAYKVCR